MTLTYQEFLLHKGQSFAGTGIDRATDEIHERLFPFQAAIVRWALRKGRAAIFAGTGLGKTLMQVEWARHIPGRVLIFAPLCVGDQTVPEAVEKLGVSIGAPEDLGARIAITNYERVHKINPADWGGVVLDESSILKAVDSSTRAALTDAFQRTQYRLCCTATPAPNDPVEIGNHSQFLGIMSRAEMLASFFVNRGEGNRTWDLKGHAREAFYRWLA